jgi:hypothetical protein
MVLSSTKKQGVESSEPFPYIYTLFPEDPLDGIEIEGKELVFVFSGFFYWGVWKETINRYCTHIIY